MPGMKKTMQEYKGGKLHSGSKKGPLVKSRKQAIAIGISEQTKTGGKIPGTLGDNVKRASGGNY